ncbi:hypothetical protein [Desulfoscipio geothermicus]|uniref:Uncharacterized protein n=1 Tax=Desulfoscipio geothermicus DSM 3669 TaxID=1121426 RepID=A0A1I6DT66_9FIRM|nr:hypothetical protein [Desulfoscipio geothermicus]SFR08616.1 hypothetical protein SAMN05660706_11715 [Desulfoscipio geothermicus DSM 3669]
MVKKKSKPEKIITPSGHEVDRDLARVPIKVSPSLQALMANQMELIEMAEGKVSRNLVFVEQHKLEMLQLEEEIAGAFSGYLRKKEKAREKRLKKQALDKANHEPVHVADEPAPVTETEPAVYSGGDQWPARGERAAQIEDDSALPDVPFDLIHTDIESSSPSPAGLPSSRYETRRTVNEPKKEETDVRRIALGASIKALQAFLGRELTEEEMQSLEAQVESYLG